MCEKIMDAFVLNSFESVILVCGFGCDKVAERERVHRASRDTNECATRDLVHLQPERTAERRGLCSPIPISVPFPLDGHNSCSNPNSVFFPWALLSHWLWISPVRPLAYWHLFHNAQSSTSIPFEVEVQFVNLSMWRLSDTCLSI